MEAIGGIVFLLLLLSMSVVWIVALVQAVKVPDDQFRTGSKLLWVLLIALTHIVGAVIYWAVGRPRAVA
ncbi:MAG: PLDc N-terminal domain-containing protein [Acidimicrobiales bacterium]